ncbi:MAG TPA: hypothetical protein VHD85_01945 [Terracidiphilus sp.]|nr:hypothetical protein [Terracidiphilus sp.]
MRYRVVKGRFTLDQDRKGAAHITCNICAKAGIPISPSDSDPTPYKVHLKTSTPPGDAELADAQKQLEEYGNPADPSSVIAARRRLTPSSPYTMKPFLVAPMMLNGRPSGNVQPIVCFHCKQVGLLLCETERVSPNGYRIAITRLNQDPMQHAIQRAEVTYTVLLCLDFMCALTMPNGGRFIAPTAHVVCPGASIQTAGKKGKGKQDAHQVLREMTIDGHAIYDLARTHPSVPQEMRNTLVYCHATISHLDEKYNNADGLVETEIVVDFIELAQQIISGRLRRVAQYDSVTRRYLWRLLMIRYYYACRVALIKAAGDEQLVGVLNEYLLPVTALRDNEPPGFVNELDAVQMCDRFKQNYRQI